MKLKQMRTGNATGGNVLRYGNITHSFKLAKVTEKQKNEKGNEKEIILKCYNG